MDGRDVSGGWFGERGGQKVWRGEARRGGGERDENG